ncbi:TolC family protein [Cytophaga aurantiaca]|uniref:TolC family protein n=1 Tax=Cytophaga aurantiaca TaxID=29530 RepID=UPI00037370B9|nr:TolC family protein [Cytophaga aurantiaca]
MRLYILGLMLVITATQAMAQQKLTLKQCIDYSLTNHLSNQVYQNNVEIANQQGREALAGYLPQVALVTNFDNNLKLATSIIPGGGPFGPDARKFQMGQRYATTSVLQLDQTIFDQSMIYGIKANTPNKEIAALNAQQNQETLIYNTTAAYIEAAIYGEKIRILSINENKYKELLSIKKLQYEKGTATQVDYNRILVTYKNIVAEKTLAETNRDLALNKLKDAMGMTLDEKLTINDSLDYERLIPTSKASDFDETQLFTYKINSQKIHLQEIDVKRKRAAYYPTLTGYARYGAQSYSQASNNLFHTWFDYSAIGLKLSIPVFSGFRKESQLKQSELNLMNLQKNFIITNNTLKLQALNANTQLQKSYNDVANNKENLNLAQEVFDITNLQYQKGMGTLTDLLNAEYSLKEAQNNYITSMLNLLSSTLNNEKANGTLIPFAQKL